MACGGTRHTHSTHTRDERINSRHKRDRRGAPRTERVQLYINVRTHGRAVPATAHAPHPSAQQRPQCSFLIPVMGSTSSWTSTRKLEYDISPCRTVRRSACTSIISTADALTFSPFFSSALTSRRSCRLSSRKERLPEADARSLAH